MTFLPKNKLKRTVLIFLNKQEFSITDTEDGIHSSSECLNINGGAGQIKIMNFSKELSTLSVSSIPLQTTLKLYLQEKTAKMGKTVIVLQDV